MSSRLACWLHGHTWLPPSPRLWQDIVGNLWRIQTCDQCHAQRRLLHRRWDQTT